MHAGCMVIVTTDTTHDTHVIAAAFDVKDGALLIYDYSRTLVRAYAPGTWTGAAADHD